MSNPQSSSGGIHRGGFATLVRNRHASCKKLGGLIGGVESTRATVMRIAGLGGEQLLFQVGGNTLIWEKVFSGG